MDKILFAGRQIVASMGNWGSPHSQGSVGVQMGEGEEEELRSQAARERPWGHLLVVGGCGGGEPGLLERAEPSGVQGAGPVPGAVGGWGRGPPECQGALEAVAWRSLWLGAGQMATGLPVPLSRSLCDI